MKIILPTLISLLVCLFLAFYIVYKQPQRKLISYLFKQNRLTLAILTHLGSWFSLSMLVVIIMVHNMFGLSFFAFVIIVATLGYFGILYFIIAHEEIKYSFHPLLNLRGYL